MRISGYTDKTGQKQHLFTALVQECQLAAPGSRLSDKLKRKIEEFARDDRKDVVTKTVDGCAPLFLACKNGSSEMADYLLSKCDAAIEQRGLFEVLDEGVSHSVTPLWCAAVSGRLAVVRVLLKHGADVNAVSDSGSTPVRSACYIVRHGLNTSHMEIIRALVEAGADVQKPNHFGGTCLINSVQSPELVQFLIKSGVDVNAEDVQHKTALHYAVQEHRLETTKVLLTNGADPHKKSKYGDDILQTACLKGALMIFNYIIETVKYDTERIANAFELLGSTFLLDLHDMASTLFFWNKALEIRSEEAGADCPKSFLTTHPVLGVQEFSTKEQLEVYSFDSSLMKLQGLLITERILGQQHKDTIFRYMYSGAAHADSNEYHPCIMLWNYALKLKINKETLLACDTSFTIRAVVQLFLNILIREEVQDDLEFSDVLNTTKYINAGLQHSVNLLNILPQFKTHKENLDLVLQSWLHLVYLLLRLAQDNEDRREVYHIVKTVSDIAPVSSTGDSVLHMAVSSSSAVRSNSFLDDDSISLFPSFDVIKFLVNCGISTQLRNNDRETPLHIAAMKENFKEDIAVFLLENGSHLDSKDCMGLSPLNILQTHPCKLNVMKYVSLQCLASCAIRKYRLQLVAGQVPTGCIQYFKAHL